MTCVVPLPASDADAPSLRPTVPSDRAFLDAVLAASYARAEIGFGYPRCIDTAELVAEIGIYGLSLGGAMVVVDVDGAPACAFGFLHERSGAGAPTSAASAFLVGPFAADRLAGDHALAGFVALAEGEASRRGLRRLVSVLTVENERLAGVFLARGWQPGRRAVEMLRRAADAPAPPAVDPRIRLLARGNAGLTVAAQVLAQGLGWPEPAEHAIEACLDDGCALAVVDEGGILGTVVYMPVEDTDFGRIEYLAVRPDSRGRGVGAALVDAAVAALHAVGCVEVFLNLDADNAAARSLYGRSGFRETVRSVEYVSVPG